MENKLDKERLEWVTDRTNRSRGQTQFLFGLLEGDFEKLLELERKIKNCHISYCPETIEEVEEIMKMECKERILKFESFKNKI